MIMNLIDLLQLALDAGSFVLPHVAFLCCFDLFLQLTQSCLAQKSGNRVYNDHDYVRAYIAHCVSALGQLARLAPRLFLVSHFLSLFLCMLELFWI